MMQLRKHVWFVMVIISFWEAPKYVEGRPNTSDPEKPTMSVWARKAGGNWRPELAAKAPDSPNPIPNNMQVKVEPDYSDELYPRERDCGRKKFWHIRGLRCVPYQCPGGNKFRNAGTGECTLAQFGNEGRGSGNRRYYGRGPGHHTKRPIFRRGKLIIG